MLKAGYSNEFGDKPTSNTTNILVIDNNILLINLLKKSLVQDDIKIAAVTNIEDAIQLLKEKIFDAVLCDGPIDNYSKETILEIFEQNNFLQDQRIVLFSGLIQPDFIEKWKRRGLYNYIKKPTSRKKILEFLQATKKDVNSKKTFNSQTIQEQVKEDGEEEEEEATPEQLAKVEELTKEIEELESYSTKLTPSTEITHKAEIDLESAEQVKEDGEEEEEEEATPEQLAKVEELTKEIEELESYSTKLTPSTEITHKAEIDLESAEQVKEDGEEEEEEEEATPEQLAKVEELTKEIEELESYSTKLTPSTEITHKAEIDYSKTSKVIESSSPNTLKTQLSQTTFETQTNSEFKNILSKLASIKNQFLYNTSDISDIDRTQTTEELFNLKKEIGKIRRKVYGSRPKQKRSKSASIQNRGSKKRRLSKKKRK
ncbi:response regulator [Nitrosopumilus sp.]|uniref:response regulator n=1 Tax=Nitrosopumilus sp. TaxID=2024843 RepID=UPI002930F17D|nr:response regulator [Nitrosopumilus sp.]